VPQVRLIDADGEQRGIVPTDEAKRIAQDAGLDLVEVSPNERPPVCKVMDYGKHKYESKKKANEQKKKQKRTEVKEVKFRPKTGEHDFDTKVRKLRTFLYEGNKGKITVMFRGREIVHKEIGAEICDRVAYAVKDLAQIETPPRMEGRSMFMMLAPISKKGKAPAPAPAPVPDEGKEKAA
jgi:translation initiation factor IF-3